MTLWDFAFKGVAITFSGAFSTSPYKGAILPVGRGRPRPMKEAVSLKIAVIVSALLIAAPAFAGENAQKRGTPE